MVKRIGSFAGVGGARLCMQAWMPGTPAVAAVVLMHGGNNHCDMDYLNALAETLTVRGYCVYSYDQRGFGRSEGIPMHMDCKEDARGDLAAFLRLIRAEQAGGRVFLLGISFGACQAADAAITAPHLLDGVILTSFSTVPLKLPGAMRGIVSLVGRFFPRATIPATPAEHFPGAREALAGTKLWSDPLCPRTMTFGMLKVLTAWQKALGGELRFLTVPTLHLQGLKDDITPPDPAIRRKIGTADYTCMTYENAGHDILEGPDAPAAMHDIADWLDAWA